MVDCAYLLRHFIVHAIQRYRLLRPRPLKSIFESHLPVLLVIFLANAAAHGRLTSPQGFG